MKSKIFCLFSATVMVLFLTSCGEEFFGISGAGQIKSETRVLTGFDKIELSVYAEIEIIKDSVFKIEISDYENLLEHIHTSVRGESLVIKKDPVNIHLRNSNAKIYIAMPSLEALTISSSGKISVLSGFNGLQDIAISGSGDIEASEPFETPLLHIVISGSGNVTAEGVAEELNTNISASGNIYLFNLVAQHANCTISGSGNTYVNVVQTLDATISGSGNIEYMGNPIVDVSISGSGKVRSR